MLLQSCLDQGIHFDMIQVLLLGLVYYGVVVGHIAIRLIADLALLARFNLRLQILCESVHHLLLVLINQQSFFRVPRTALFLLVKVTHLKVHIRNRYVIPLHDGRVRSTQNRCCLLAAQVAIIASGRPIHTSFESNSVDGREHYLQKVIILVGLAHEVILGNNGLLVC